MGTFLVVGSAAAVVFLIVAARWLLVLRAQALSAKLPLTPLDKLLAAAPIGYTVLCFVAGGMIADRAAVISPSSPEPVLLPLLGWSSAHTASIGLWLLVGLAAFTPFVVVSTVETYYSRRLPELVRLGRRAVFSLLTGVRPPDGGAGAENPAEAEDLRWTSLLRR
jgi:hypothetical protein